MSLQQPGWLLRECEAILEQCERGREDMRAYQSDLLLPFLLNNPRSAAFVGMGLGKTITVLTLLDLLLTAGVIKKALIIAPVRVAVQTWPTEMRLWRHTAWMEPTVIRPDPDSPDVTSAMKAARARERLEIMGSPNTAAGKARTAVFAAQRERKARTPNLIHIINREHIKWLVELFPGKLWPYDCIIVDESTSFADHNSQRFKALAKVAQRVKRFHLLTGTPAPEGIQDLFAQIYLLDQGERFGRMISQFRFNYMRQNPYSKAWEALPGADKTVAEKIADIAIVMKEEDYLDLKTPIVIERPIVLEPEELKAYRVFERTMILALDDEEGTEIEAVNAGVLSGKLLQYASGAVFDNERQWHSVHDHKIEEMKEIVEETKGTPLLVAYWFRPSKERLIKAFPKAVVMDKEGKCVDKWNAGKIPMLLVHPASAGHGLNMQLGPGHILVFFDTPASLELYLQLIKRIARSGQKRLVRIIHLVAQGTLDKLAVPRLMKKEGAQETIMQYIRARRAEIRRAKRG